MARNSQFSVLHSSQCLQATDRRLVGVVHWHPGHRAVRDTHTRLETWCFAFAVRLHRPLHRCPGRPEPYGVQVTGRRAQPSEGAHCGGDVSPGQHTHVHDSAHSDPARAGPCHDVEVRATWPRASLGTPGAHRDRAVGGSAVCAMHMSRAGPQRFMRACWRSVATHPRSSRAIRWHSWSSGLVLQLACTGRQEWCGSVLVCCIGRMVCRRA